MEQDIIGYFAGLASAPDAPKRLLNRTARELYRGNITTMRELCALCEGSPETIQRARGIGEKSRALILEVCARYKENLK